MATLRDSLSGYAVPIAVSVVLHGGLLLLLTFGWESSTLTPTKVVPRFVEAKLVTLKSESKSTTAPVKPKVIDIVAKRREQERQKALREQKSRLAKEKAERERLRKLAEEKQQKIKEAEKRLAAEAKARAEQERLAREANLERQRQREAAMAEALAGEAELMAQEQAQNDAQSYVALIAHQIEQNWSRPPSARKGMKCELSIQLVPTGEVVDVAVVSGSGNAAFDRSAVQAVKKVGRFSELNDMPASLFESYFRRLTLVFNPQDLRL